MSRGNLNPQKCKFGYFLPQNVQIFAIFTQKSSIFVKFFPKKCRSWQFFPPKVQIWTLFHSWKWKIGENFLTIFLPSGEKIEIFGRIHTYDGSYIYHENGNPIYLKESIVKLKRDNHLKLILIQACHSTFSYSMLSG